MGRKCEGCNFTKYFDCMECKLCVFILNDSHKEPCLSCRTNNCNFKFNLELLEQLLDLQQVKSNLEIAINSESDLSLKKLLAETLKLLEDKDE